MHRFFIPKTNINEKSAFINDKDDVKHAAKALRIEIGESIELCDDSGIEHVCEVCEITSDQIICEIKSSEINTRESAVKITLFQGLPKADKLEMIIQKTTELGIHSVVPVSMKRSVVKWKNDKSSSKKLERWNRIAFEAAKQSKRGLIPKVESPLTVQSLGQCLEAFDLVLLPYENEEAQGIAQIVDDYKRERADIRVGIIIGPEGGFAKEEVDYLVEHGAKSVKLGPRILRTETAGLVSVTIVQYALGDLGNL